MRIFMTGATGFIGGHVADRLLGRGDELRLLVRDASGASAFAERGAELIEGDLSDQAAIERGLEGCDAAIHGAAMYELGVPLAERPRMHEANVLGTQRVLDAALGAGVDRAVYISSVVAFGNTRGRVVDETHQHPGTGFTSYYEETKYRAHQVAEQLIARGLDCVIVQPGGVYGPDDHSQLGNLIGQYVSGRLPLIPFPDLGITLVHVEDVADGVLGALDSGEAGESYVLGGTVTTNREMLQTAARVMGKRRSSVAMPTSILRAIAPLGPAIGPLLGFPKNMRELVQSSDGVTFWARHAKASEAFGYAPRDLEATLRDTMVAEGRLPA